METTLFSREENFSFWKNLVMSLIFFILTPITLGVSLYSLFTLKDSEVRSPASLSNIVTYPVSGLSVYASLPTNLPSVSGSVGSSDARPEIVKQYLEYYDSPLVQYSYVLVQTADKYGLDYRLITAIAQQESNLCKIIPPGSYNCWGWGIHSKGSLGFDSFQEGIETVSKGVKEEYIDKGYSTVEDIMSKYTPMSNGSWANGVNQFMAAMQ